MSSFWCIVFYIRNIILLGSTTKNNGALIKLAPRPAMPGEVGALVVGSGFKIYIYIYTYSGNSIEVP